MSCGCANRMRRVLVEFGYTLDPDQVWRRAGDSQEFPDSRIEEDHFRVLIETLSAKLSGVRTANFLRKIGRSRP